VFCCYPFPFPQAIKVNKYVEIEEGNLDQRLYLIECEQTLPTKQHPGTLQTDNKTDTPEVPPKLNEILLWLFQFSPCHLNLPHKLQLEYSGNNTSNMAWKKHTNLFTGKAWRNNRQLHAKYLLPRNQHRHEQTTRGRTEHKSMKDFKSIKI